MWVVPCEIGVPPILTSVAIGLGNIAGRAPILRQATPRGHSRDAKSVLL